MNKYEWYKIDTAAIMFASIQGKNTSRVFRGSFVLKNEEVDGEILKKAVYDILPRFPFFCVTYKAGCFWPYLEKTDILPVVKEDTQYPAAVMWHGKNGGPEFRVLYYKRRISVEIAHMLTDGSGSSALMKAILERYFILKGDITEADLNEEKEIPFGELSENAYKKNYNGEKPAPSVKREVETHKLPMNPIENYLKIIFGIFPASQIKEKCKKYGTTVTEYLAAAEILAIIRKEKDPISKAIRISVPVNLRNFLPSETLRNFAGDTCLSFYPEGKEDYTFEDVISEIKGTIKKRISKEYAQNFVNSTYSQTVNPVTRFVPYFIKHKVVNASQKKDHSDSMTMILTNVGVTDLPKALADKIERVESIPGNVTDYGLSITSSPITHNGFVNMSFSINNKDTSLCKEFFRILSEDGIDVRIESTDDNGFDKNSRNEEGKRCTHCDVDLGEEYTVCPLCGEKAINEKKKIEGFKTAEFTDSFETPDFSQPKVNNKHLLSKEKLKAYFNI